MKCRLFLNIVVGGGLAVLKLLAGQDQALLARRDTLLVLDLGLDIVNGVGGFGLKGNGLACQGLGKICIPPQRQRTKWRVNCFWALVQNKG